MTVEELVNKLSVLDPSAEVVIDPEYYLGNYHYGDDIEVRSEGIFRDKLGYPTKEGPIRDHTTVTIVLV